MDESPLQMIAKDDIYPAPTFERAIPPTEPLLRELLGDPKIEPQVWFALGNFYLRDSRIPQAITAFERAIAGGVPSLELLTNYGVALIEGAQFDASLTQFRQALLLAADQFLPNFHLARALEQIGDLAGARLALERALRVRPQHVRALAAYARIVEALDGLGAAISDYLRVLEFDPHRQDIREKLALHDFDKIRRLFEEAKTSQAFSELWSAHRNYAPAFVTSQVLAAKLQHQVKEIQKSFRVRQKLREYRRVCEDSQKTADFAYPMFGEFLFSLGLFPDFYELLETLDQEAERWRRSLVNEGEHPFPHFRLALIHGFKGEFEQALVELRICQDRLPPKKQNSLRLGKILAFVGDLVEVKRRVSHLTESASGASEWAQFGFADPFQSEAWRKVGFGPQEARTWKDAGFSPKQALSWSRLRVEATRGREWVEAGYVSAKAAREWVRGGFSPEQARSWQQSFGGSSAEAVQWFKAGFENPETAARWAALVLFPWDAMRWIENGFSLEDTASFYERGVRDTYQALREQRSSAQQNSETPPTSRTEN